jgi:hypothetical protein
MFWRIKPIQPKTRAIKSALINDRGFFGMKHTAGTRELRDR